MSWASADTAELKLLLPAGGEKPLDYLNASICLQRQGGDIDLFKHLLHLCFITSLEKKTAEGRGKREIKLHTNISICSENSFERSGIPFAVPDCSFIT